MLVVTTPIIEGKKIKKYIGPVFCQTTRGVGYVRGMGAGFKSFTGGRSSGHEESIIEVRSTAIEEMIQQARIMGANALIGVTVDIEMLSDNALILCKGFATAVIIEGEEESTPVFSHPINQANVNTCSNCGGQVTSEFCTNCGTKR